MKKRIFSRVLAFAMALTLCFSLLSVTAFADEEPSAPPDDVIPTADTPVAEPPVYVAEATVTVTGDDGSTTEETKQFTSIADAIKAIDGNGTVKLLPQEGADAENPTEITEEVKIEKGQNITLDIPENVRLQNATDGKNETGNTAGRSTIYVLDGGVLTVQGGGAVVSQRETGLEGAAWGDGFALYNQSGGKVILLGCTFSNQNTNVYKDKDGTVSNVKRTHYTIFNAGTMEVNGSTIDSDASRNPSQHPEVLGQEIKGANTQVVSTGSLTISKINVIGTMSVGVWNQGGQLVVDDGDFTKWMCVQTSNGATTNINGGNYAGRTDPDDGSGSSLLYNSSTSKLNINGGHFVTEEGKTEGNLFYNVVGQITVSGGYYDKEVAEKVLAAEVVCINVDDSSNTPWQVGYLTLTDTDTNRLLYTNLGDGTTTMVPTFALQNGKDLNGLDRSKATNITWTTSDDSIASVDSNGHVTARSNGEVTIVATYEVNGKKVSQEYKVTVDTVYVPVYIEDFDPTPTDTSTGTTITDAETPLAGLVTLAELLEALREYEGIEDVELPEDFQWSDHDYAQAICWGLDEALVVDTEDDPLDPDEIVTVALLREVLENFVEYKGADLTVTVDGEDDMIVMDLGERLTVFYGELEAALETQAA